MSINEIYPQKVWIGSLIVSFSLSMIVRQNTFQTEESREKNILGTSFHPELTSDFRFHNYFIQNVV